MDWLKTIAPLLGTALAGPLGGAAASFMADKLGVPDKTVKAVSELLQSGQMSPEQIAGIKQAELEFQKFLETNKIDLARLNVENTRDARDMQKVTRSSTPAVLSYFVTGGFFAILITMLAMEIKPSEPLLIMLGSLAAAFGGAVNFWLGSSHGSQIKTEHLKGTKS